MRRNWPVFKAAGDSDMAIARTFGLAGACLVVALENAHSGPPVGTKHPDPSAIAHLLTSGSADALGGSLRGYLIHAVPDPLYESSRDWGRTARVARGIKWTGRDLPLKPEIIKGEKNQGDWRKVRVTAPNLPDNLIVDLRDVRPAEPGRMTFTVFLAFDARVEYQHQKWEAGMRLYDASARARMRVKATLDCELTSRIEPADFLLSDLVFRIRLTKSDLRFENLVLEHAAGIGGEGAKLLGDAVKHSLHEWHPSLERELLARANAAIVKAGDTKEVRLSLLKLMRNQGVLPEPDGAIKKN
jgi:hypothetical protein